MEVEDEEGQKGYYTGQPIRKRPLNHCMDVCEPLSTGFVNRIAWNKIGEGSGLGVRGGAGEEGRGQLGGEVMA